MTNAVVTSGYYNRVTTPAACRQRLQPRINRLTFQREHSKNAFMHTPQRFFAYESFERFHAKGKFTQGQ
jgi:hypothetical protein